MNTEDYNELETKLDAFIKKYYTNLLIKGGLYFTSLITLSYLTIVGLESIGRFGTTTRSILFFSFLTFLIFILYRFIGTPLLRLYQIGSRISSEQAALIIGKHFKEVDDRLLNTLQLKKASDLNPEENGLIIASIKQRSLELKLET